MSRYKSAAKIVTTDPQLAAWCSIIENNFVQSDVVEDGYLTSAQLAHKLGKSHSTMRGHLSLCETRGTIKVKMFRIKTTSGTRLVKHYKPT